MYPFSASAIQYTLKQLFAIAGVSEWEPVLLQSDHPLQICLEPVPGKRITFHLLSGEEISQLLQGGLSPAYIKTIDRQSDFPLFYTETDYTTARLEDDTLHIYADLISLPFILLSRYEELICDRRDTHGRFQYQDSIACRYRFIDVPLVDEYGLLLRKLLTNFIPSLDIIPRKGKILPTHDIDMLFRFGNCVQNLRTIIGGDLLKQHNLARALRSVRECCATRRDRYNDPLVHSVERLCLLSQEAGLTSTFYFKALHGGDKDATYDIDSPELKRSIEFIREHEMEIGLHGSYDSYTQGETLQNEKAALEVVCQQPVTQLRQHFLRFDIRHTLPAWQQGNLRHDSTLGFAEREGFRCGTGHPYPLFDWQNDCASRIMEHPLIVMDGTLIDYRRMNAGEALERIRLLCHRALSTEGDFVILWHNHTLIREFETYFRKTYLPFLQSL